jgi:hypothetical protein
MRRRKNLAKLLKSLALIMKKMVRKVLMTKRTM